MEQDKAIVCEGLTKEYSWSNDTKIIPINNLSFVINKGDLVGIIGKNGSGKSTLLKILAGVVKPSSGSSIIYGRLVAVLEIGAGFIPELSGIDNIRLSCRLNGLNSASTEVHIAEIIEFSELSYAINEPVKNYSQGMFLRLAMSLVFSLKASIYLFDEVITVGDEAFRIKCFDKMKSLKNSGATILITMHDLYTIEELCNRCIELRDGHIYQDSNPHLVCNTYRKFMQSNLVQKINSDIEFKYIDETYAIVDYFSLTSESDTSGDELFCSDELVFELRWHSKISGYNLAFHLNFYNNEGALFLSTNNRFGKTFKELEHIATETLADVYYTEKLILPGNFLNEGTYRLEVNLIAFKNPENTVLVANTIEPIIFKLKENNTDIYISQTNSSIRTLLNWSIVNPQPKLA